MIAEELLKTEYDAARLVFNRFQSAIAFKPTITTVLSPDALEKEMEAGGALDQYEVEGPDRAELLQDLGEFQLATVRITLSPDSSSVHPALHQAGPCWSVAHYLPCNACGFNTSFSAGSEQACM